MNILRRIGNLQRSMQLLSDGDLETEIHRSSQRDEIATMANSLQIFRESMIEARALSADQDKDRIAKAERASRMEARIIEFGSGLRPAFPDNLPRIGIRGERIAVNGLYRHGFLIAPALAELTLQYVQRGQIDNEVMQCA